MSNRAWTEGPPDDLTRVLANGIDCSANWISDIWDARHFRSGAIQATWSGISTFLGVLYVQVSVNGVGWNDSGVIEKTDIDVDNASDTGIWEIKIMTAPYYRVRYEANGNATGSCTVKARGRGFQ